MINNILRNSRIAKLLSLLPMVALFVFVHVASAGTLTNFSYSSTNYGIGATADYTFNYTLETADPNMIFYASWPAGFGHHKFVQMLRLMVYLPHLTKSILMVEDLEIHIYD